MERLVAALLGPLAIAYGAWGFEALRLGGAAARLSFAVRLGVAAWGALAVLACGAVAAALLIGLERLGVLRRAQQVSRGAWCALGIVYLGLSLGVYLLYQAAEAFLVASATKSLFVSWAAAGLMLLLAGSLALGMPRERPSWQHPVPERVLVPVALAVLALPLGLLFFEAEVFTGIEGWAWTPMLAGAAGAVVGHYWMPRWQPAKWVSLAAACVLLGAGAYGFSAHDNEVELALEQHSVITRKVIDVKGVVSAPQEQVAAGSTGSCWPDRKAKDPANVGKADAKGPDIVLAMVDAVRWDHLAMGGYERDTMPHLERYAKSGLVFSKAYTQSASTRQTFRALLTGLLPSQVAKSRGKSKWALSLPEGQPTLAEYLQAAGFDTIAIHTTKVFLEDHTRALAGFRVTDDKPAQAWKREGYSANVHVDRIIAYLEKETSKGPRFIFSHMMEPHQPFRASPQTKKFGGTRRDRYDTSLRYVDNELERLFQFVSSPERKDRTFVVLAADHGMGVGDRNDLKQHGNSVYDDQVRVPLVIVGPGVKPQRVDTPVSLHDLFPTVIDMAGLQPLEHVCGQSLLPIAVGSAEPQPRPTLVEIFPDHANANFKVAWVDTRYKLVLDVRRKQRALFDLQHDPGETRDVLAERAEDAGRLLTELKAALLERGRAPEAYGL